MILLSNILKRLDQIAEKLEVIAGQWMPDRVGRDARGAGNGEKKTAPPFADYIRDRIKAELLLNYLHDKIETRWRVDALVFIQAAMDAGALSHPPYAVACAEFPGHLGAESTYNEYIGSADSFSTRRRVRELADATEEIRALLIGG